MNDNGDTNKINAKRGRRAEKKKSSAFNRRIALTETKLESHAAQRNDAELSHLNNKNLWHKRYRNFVYIYDDKRPLECERTSDKRNERRKLKFQSKERNEFVLGCQRKSQIETNKVLSTSVRDTETNENERDKFNVEKKTPRGFDWLDPDINILVSTDWKLIFPCRRANVRQTAELKNCPESFRLCFMFR